jgi:hypothetical protein
LAGAQRSDHSCVNRSHISKLSTPLLASVLAFLGVEDKFQWANATNRAFCAASRSSLASPVADLSLVLKALLNTESVRLHIAIAQAVFLLAILAIGAYAATPQVRNH